MKTITTILILFLIWPGSLTAQSQGTEELAIERIKSLEELLRLAEQNLTSLRALNSSQKILLEQTKMAKKDWLTHISATAGANYGNGIVAGQLFTGSAETLSYTTTQNVTYNVGINIRLPFNAVASRKNEIKIKQLEIEQIEGLKQEQRDLIRSEVIRRYTELKSNLETLKIKAEVVEANDVAMKVSENYFKAGKMDVEKYRAALDVTYTAKLEYDMAKNQAWYNIRMLRELVGEEIIK